MRLRAPCCSGASISRTAHISIEIVVKRCCPSIIRNLETPTGTLRAAFLATNPVQARIDPRTGAVTGPVADLARELARRLGVPSILLPEPNPAAVLEQLLPRYVATRLFQAILEAKASEESSRMVAMKNATENAEELIEDLTLSYNKVRQANITREMIEIASGAQAR